MKGLALCGNPACTETCASAGGVGPFGSYAGGAFLGGSPASHAGDPFGGGAFRGKEAHNSSSSSSRALELPAGLKSSGRALAVINLALSGGAFEGSPAGAWAETCAGAGGGGATSFFEGNGGRAATCAAVSTLPGSRAKALMRIASSCVSPSLVPAPTGAAFVARFSAAVAAASAATRARFLSSRRACRTGAASLGGGTLALCTGALDGAGAWAETVSFLWEAWIMRKSVQFE